MLSLSLYCANHLWIVIDFIYQLFDYISRIGKCAVLSSLVHNFHRLHLSRKDHGYLKRQLRGIEKWIESFSHPLLLHNQCPRWQKNIQNFRIFAEFQLIKSKSEISKLILNWERSHMCLLPFSQWTLNSQLSKFTFFSSRILKWYHMIK